MKRSRLESSRKPIRARNVRRHLKNWYRQFGSVERVRKIQALPCFVPDCPNLSENCHTHSRRTATWLDIFNACHDHHFESHQVGLDTFAAKYGVDPWAQAAWLATEIPV